MVIIDRAILSLHHPEMFFYLTIEDVQLIQGSFEAMNTIFSRDKP